MKRFVKVVFHLVLLCLVLVDFCPVSHAVDISARSAILICADSGSVVFAKNEFEPLPMASTTKIMTAILALENIEACGNREIEITDEMVRVEGTSMGLVAGNTVNLEALVQGMMMVSGNDAANAAAIAVAGNTEAFVDKMNEKARLIGMRDTLFCTPSGLDKDDHHSTAYDMAVLGAYAMENENFEKIVSQKSMKIHFINPNKYVTMRNHNKLLRLYDGCTGIKTGFTKAAGRCLVSCAQKNGAKLICVTLNAPNDWDDHTKLFDYGFANVTVKTFNDGDYFVDIPVNGKEIDHIQGKGNTVFEVCVRKEDENKIRREIEIPSVCALPIERGQILGNVVYYIGDNVIGKNPIVATDSFSEKVSEKENIFEIIKNFWRKIFHFR